MNQSSSISSSGSGSSSNNLSTSISVPVPQTNTNNTQVVALDFDLNKTPPSSPPNAAVPTNVAGAPADHNCNSCTLTNIPIVLCPECSNSVHVDCLKPTENTPELMCAKCSMECHRRKKIRRTVSDDNGDGDFDMNVSPPCDFDGDDVAGDNKYDLQLMLYNLRL